MLSWGQGIACRGVQATSQTIQGALSNDDANNLGCHFLEAAYASPIVGILVDLLSFCTGLRVLLCAVN